MTMGYSQTVRQVEPTGRESTRTRVRCNRSQRSKLQWVDVEYIAMTDSDIKTQVGRSGDPVVLIWIPEYCNPIIINSDSAPRVHHQVYAKYMVLDGNHRVAYRRRHGITQIRAWVINGDDQHRIVPGRNGNISGAIIPWIEGEIEFQELIRRTWLNARDTFGHNFVRKQPLASDQFGM